MTKQTPMKRRIWLILPLLAILVGFVIWGVSWATYARPPLPEAMDALKDGEGVLISSEPWLSYIPLGEKPITGLIFYPGGRIDPRGYSPLLKEISGEGYLVVVPSMPINMAIFNADIADEIIAHFDTIDNWVIGGHSVGGTAAALYTSQNPDQIDGLVIWASYPAGNSDLSQTDLLVTSIFGDMDPQASQSAVLDRSDLLPPGTIYVMIRGGDHHQFGSYLTKPGESNAIIPRDDQQKQITQATLELLDIISQKGHN